MNLGNSLKKLGIEQTFRYVYKDPEPNMRKLMDWADRFAGNEFEGQRKTIREVIENKEHPYHDFVLHLFKDVDQDVLTTYHGPFSWIRQVPVICTAPDAGLRNMATA